MMHIHRRALLASAGVTALALASGLEIARRSGGLPEALHGILERLLGPFAMQDSAFHRFVEDFQAAGINLSAFEADVIRLIESADAIRASADLYPEMARKLDILERKTLTEFALATGIQSAPDNNELNYLGLFAAGACNNPYARLS